MEGSFTWMTAQLTPPVPWVRIVVPFLICMLCRTLKF